MEQVSNLKTLINNGILGHYIIFQNNHLEIWTTLDLSLVAISQRMDNYYSALSIFSLNMGHPQPTEIVIIKESEISENLQ